MATGSTTNSNSNKFNSNIPPTQFNQNSNNNNTAAPSSTNSLTNSLTINNSLTNSNSSGVAVIADAATVAIAKDMLQLHHGSAHNNNNNNNNNNSSNNANDGLNCPANNNNNNNNNLNNRNSASLVVTPPAPQQQRPPPPPEHAVGFLKYDDELLYVTEPCTVIGRNSSTSHVHFHVAENNLVSRKHFQVLFDADTREFYVQCLSKNGIFVDDFLQRRTADALKLPPSCYFRFPSTEIRIQFESFLHVADSASGGVSGAGGINNPLSGNHHSLTSSASTHHMLMSGGSSMSGNVHHVIISPTMTDDMKHQQLYGGQQHHHQQHIHHISGHQQQQHGSMSSGGGGGGNSHILTMDSSNVIYSPLKISIPKKEQKSPYLSPTGTISAANSCPASPRQGFHQNQNYSNYTNNNLQNQQDLFQTPSTASYNQNDKPPYSYAQLIVQAISAAPDKQLTLSGIYSFIVKHYPYYRKETNKGWQNSIRHNLSLNRYFIKVARSQDEPGKGSFWRIDPDSGAKLIDHSYKKRRQRSSQGFRPSYGMPRSAPVSPSHMEYSADNSRESSPLQDIVLQSAPGSPGMSLENRNNEGEVVYQNQNVQQSAAAAANNNHQYNSPYYVTNQNAIISQQQQQQQENSGGGGGVAALIALKRNHAMAAGTGAVALQQQQQQQQLQGLHPDIIYEELPTDYSGNMESGDECDAAKRPKYVSEVL
ncbi:forkhead box K isoform 1-T6 [Glossina fuscipes fuscipes]